MDGLIDNPALRRPRSVEELADPILRTVGECMCGLAATTDLTIRYAGAQRLGDESESDRSVLVPELPAVPTTKDVAVLRGHADAAAFRYLYHDAELHRRLAPSDPGLAAVFRRIEHVRIDTLGTRHMKGAADNIAAMLDERYLAPRFAGVVDQAGAPIGEALAVMVRERLIGVVRRYTFVEFWRPVLEQAFGAELDRLAAHVDDQTRFARRVLHMLSRLDAARDGEPTDGAGGPPIDPKTDEPGEIERDSLSQGAAEGLKVANEEASGQRTMHGEAAEGVAPTREEKSTATTEPDGEVTADASQRRRTETLILEDAYRAFTTQYDRVIHPDKLLTQDRLIALRQEIDA
ncbi:MAG: hypothetical protein KIT73_18345, partial [Burkholderiales bacterium]|nr:hypothetical protein [Burkholderiales bacterium]